MFDNPIALAVGLAILTRNAHIISVAWAGSTVVVTFSSNTLIPPRYTTMLARNAQVAFIERAPKRMVVTVFMHARCFIPCATMTTTSPCVAGHSWTWCTMVVARVSHKLFLAADTTMLARDTCVVGMARAII